VSDRHADVRVAAGDDATPASRPEPGPVAGGGGGGPLAGYRVIELSGMGPVPFCGRLLSDMGADVVRVDRLAPAWSADLQGDPYDVNARGRRSVAVDLKSAAGVDVILGLVERADALIEGYRPGVTERLGIGPDECLERNPRLVYGRCSGWGRTGPLRDEAGHDLSYVALSGALSLIGDPAQPPPALLGFLGDHGGGGMLLTVGVLSALLESRGSGRGQIVDASILDGATVLTSSDHDLLAQGARTDERWSYLADGSAPFYGCYETADGRYVAASAVEPKFYVELLDLLGLDPAELPPQGDQAAWPGLRARFAERFRTRTRDEWCTLAAGRDACLAPVLTLSEAPRHPHHLARGTFTEVDGAPQPSPSPLFSRTPAPHPRGRPRRGQHTTEALRDWGFNTSEIDRWLGAGVVADTAPTAVPPPRAASGPSSGAS
jgi:alpha-methylacyl-CoA racemase